MLNSILKEITIFKWDETISLTNQIEAIHALEKGQILFFPQLDFSLLPAENKFLAPQYAHGKNKNISFNSLTNALQGAQCSAEENIELQTMLLRFLQAAHILVKAVLPTYAEQLQIGRTSFRPVEIAGRVTSYRKDDTRLHVDAFPATPNQGRRILRVFTNINPHGQARIWRVGEPFIEVAKRFLPKVKASWPGKSLLLKILKITKSYRTKYDEIMLQIHDNMKADLDYQKKVPQSEIHFPPHSSWIVQTDHVSHAAMTGQYVLEQTFYLPIKAMINPELSPLRILEKLSGKSLNL